MVYDVEMSGSSYDYFGRDDDSKDIILSPAYRHGVTGEISISVFRTVNMFMDFEYSDEYDSCEIISGDFEENYYRSCFEEDEDYISDAYNKCPNCGRKINAENDAGNGFCCDCAPNH